MHMPVRSLSISRQCSSKKSKGTRDLNDFSLLLKLLRVYTLLSKLLQRCCQSRWGCPCGLLFFQLPLLLLLGGCPGVLIPPPPFSRAHNRSITEACTSCSVFTDPCVLSTYSCKRETRCSAGVMHQMGDAMGHYTWMIPVCCQRTPAMQARNRVQRRFDAFITHGHMGDAMDHYTWIMQWVITHGWCNHYTWVASCWKKGN
jgi:hypothetical protein